MDTKSINTAVAEKVAGLGSAKVVDTVVEKMVAAEVAKRAEALAAAIKLHDDTRRELNKVKADQVSLDENGQKVSETFSKQAFENKKRLTEKLTKVDKTIVSATEKDNWGDLYNLVKGGGTQTPAADDGGSNS